jgi:histone-lysine N-methyltransferase ASH1L
MYFDQNMIIDATRGSIARFVNHSCEPNCRMEKWTVGGKPRMALFAGDKGVMTGEELTYDYNFDPFSQKNVQQCRCGAPTCRGVLGPRPKEQRSKEPKPDDKKKAKIQKKSSKATLAGTKRKIENVLDESTNRLNKKRKILTGKSVKRTIKQAVSKARATLSGKKGGVVQTKKNASVTKTNAEARSARTAKTKATKTTKRGGKTISKSKVTKVTTTKAKAKPTAKAKVYQIKSKGSKVVAAPSSTGKAVEKPVSASEKVKTKLKATARRSTSFNKVTKPVLKSPATKANVAAKEKKTPVKTPSRASSVKGGAKILR